MSKIIGNTTATPVPRSDWEQTDKLKADFIRHKPTLGTIAEMNADEFYTKVETDELVSQKQDKNIIVTYTDSNKVYVSHNTDDICDAASAGIEVKFFDGLEYLDLLEYSKDQHFAVFYVDYYDSDNRLNVKYVAIGGNSVMMADSQKYNVAYKEDLNKKQDTITGAEGQVVHIDANGKVVAKDIDFITNATIDAICGGKIESVEDVMF